MIASAPRRQGISYRTRRRMGPHPVWRVRKSRALYRPLRPERTAFYQIFEHRFDRYVGVYEERFEHHYGPLRPAVPRAVEEFLACGRLLGGFARLRCPSCRREHLLAFSCRTRNLCPSCQAKRGALLAEKLTEEILLPVAHRHWVLTIPCVLRGLFERERRLLGLLSRSAYGAIRRGFAAETDDPQALPGVVASVQTFGSFANFHPHIHALVSGGTWRREGGFSPVPFPDTRLVEELFRRLLLIGLHEAERLSEEFLLSLLSWRRSGFSVHAGEPLPPGEPRLERLARYLARPPHAFSQVEIDSEDRVHLRTPPHPRTGETEIVFDPIDFVHAVVGQVPDRGQHLVRYYGVHSNRSRKIWRRRITEEEDRRSPGPHRRFEWAEPRESSLPPNEAGTPAPTSHRASWARLLKKIFEVDPLLCPQRKVPLQLVSVITEPEVVDKILAHRKRAGAENRALFRQRAPPQESDPARRKEHQPIV